MYAVFELSGFQYRAEEGAVLQVPRQKGEVGSKMNLDNVLLVQGNDNVMVGTPTVDGATIEAEIVSHGLTEKVLVFKKKRRTKYRRTQGHRQPFTELKVTRIAAPKA